MHVADYKKFDLLNGIGMRCSLFVSGCPHHCKGCFNAPAWNYNYGSEYTKKLEDQIIQDLNAPDIRMSGLSLLGGEPFANVEGLLPLLDRVKRECKDKDVWCWTGYTFDEIMACETKRSMIGYIDVLIDGKFVLEERDLTLRFRGSRNQRVLDVQKSLAVGEAMVWEG